MKKFILQNSLFISVLQVIGMLCIASISPAQSSSPTHKTYKQANQGFTSDILADGEINVGDVPPSHCSITEEGSVTNLTFYSKSLQANRAVQIYLPEGYGQEEAIGYPVIYFLHGADENSTSESGLFSIYKSLISNNTISPVIIVKPDGSVGPWSGCWYANSELYGNFEDYIVFDLVAFIDSAYNTNSSREKRSIMGYSMGGYGAMKFAFKHPDIYCGAASHSGPLDMIKFSLYIPNILSENGGAPVSVYSPDAGPWTRGAFSLSGAYSPNLNNPPYFVDFPIDSIGNWIDSVWNRWSLHNCALLARNITQDDDLAIYFDCGTQDEEQAYDFNTSFADSLDNLGLAYEFQSFTGGHYVQLIRYPTGLKFLDTVMNGMTSNIENIAGNNLASFMLYQNYPNPFSMDTHISYQLSKTSFVEIAIYDISGQKVKTLVNETKPAGVYSVDWDGRDNSNMLASSGIYIYRLSTSSYTQIRKMIILR
jgi:S-formylglutathione hydrolase FrmB